MSTVYTAFLRGGSPYTLPCPDSAATPSGLAGTCNSLGTTTGVLPWVSLGLSKNDVIDAYGNYFTYIVSTQAKTMCSTIGAAAAYSGVTAEATGSVVANTDLELKASASSSRYVPFAIIGHGPNGLGAKNSNNQATTSPTSTFEVANAASTPAIIYDYDYSTDSTNYFDDEVLAPATSDMEKVCKSLTPGDQLNAALSENFDGLAQRTSGTPDATKFSTDTTATVAADARATSSSGGNYVARFANAAAILASHATNYNFDPRVRRVYMSAKWTPDPLSAGAIDAGMSFATRATAADLTASTDDFTTGNGITFRFLRFGRRRVLRCGGGRHQHRRVRRRHQLHFLSRKCNLSRQQQHQRQQQLQSHPRQDLHH